MSLALGLRNGAFLRSHAGGPVPQQHCIRYDGTPSPPAKSWESPALCKALPRQGAAEAAVQPLGGPGGGVLGISGRGSETEAALEKCGCSEPGHLLAAARPHGLGTSPQHRASAQDGCQAWEVTWGWIFLGDRGQSAPPSDRGLSAILGDEHGALPGS